jgi:hypothetical protein
MTRDGVTMINTQIEHVQQFMALMFDGQWHEGCKLLHPEFVLTEASSLPYRGRWQGREGFVALMQLMNEYWVPDWNRHFR